MMGALGSPSFDDVVKPRNGAYRERENYEHNTCHAHSDATYL